MLILLFGFIAGSLIGLFGIGGVILVPLLVTVAGMDLHTAMASTSFSFLLPGIVGVAAYHRKKLVPLPELGWLSVGLVPAAFFGAKLNAALGSNILTILLGSLVGLSGLHALLHRSAPNQTSATQTDTRKLPRPLYILMGLAVGVGSTLTGTGGPVILVPILLALGAAPIAAVGLSQGAQLPIAVLASIAFYLEGNLDLALGLKLGISQAFGVLLGAWIAPKLPAARLKKLIAVALLGVGALIVAKVLR